MTVELDARKMTDRRTAHDYLKEQLGFPDYYGNNLDALYDLLTEQGQPMKILLRFSSEIEMFLGGYGTALLATLREAAEENPVLEFELE